MRLEVVHRDQGGVMHHRDRLCGRQTHDDAADQTGAGGGGHRRQLREARAGILHGATHDGIEQVDMGAGRDLRYYAAEANVLFGLRVHHVGQNPPGPVALALDHGGCGLIAGGLDPQHQNWLVVFQCEPFLISCAIGEISVFPSLR